MTGSGFTINGALPALESETDALSAAAPFPVPPAVASLTTRTVDAFAWRLLSESSQIVLQIGVQVTLARLLPVQTFGLLAMAMLVADLGGRISEMGTGPALIQRATITAA